MGKRKERGARPDLLSLPRLLFSLCVHFQNRRRGLSCKFLPHPQRFPYKYDHSRRVTITSKAHSVAQLVWSQVVRWVSSKNLPFLYLHLRIYLPLPPFPLSISKTTQVDIAGLERFFGLVHG